MQKLFTFFAFFLFCIASLCAQTGPIIVQQGNSSWTYADINTAIDQAPSGAYIYLPGGLIPVTVNPIVIDKEVHIVGAGFRGDSTLATGVSSFGNANISLYDGSVGCTFEGFYINQISCIENTSNLTFSRLRLDNLHIGYNSQIGGNMTPNVLIYNCIIGALFNIYYGGGCNLNMIVSNCIVSYVFTTYGGSLCNCTFKNNIFYLLYGYGYGSYPIYFPSNCTIENNIFAYPQSGNDCTFRNNILASTYSITGNGSYVNANTQNVSLNTILTSANLANGYQITDDYHVLPNSIAHNGGTDGTDIGIYGGLYPWKEGAVPSNPHIRTVTVSPASNPQGNIHVNIKVGAQDH